jgi:hypothetical protein
MIITRVRVNALPVCLRHLSTRGWAPFISMSPCAQYTAAAGGLTPSDPHTLDWVPLINRAIDPG